MRWSKAKKDRSSLWRRQAEMHHLNRDGVTVATVQQLIEEQGGRWFWYGRNAARGFERFNSLADGRVGEKTWATLAEAKAAARAAQDDPQEVSRGR